VLPSRETSKGVKVVTKLRTSGYYAKFDAAHLFDGLFVPTNGKKRTNLYVEPRKFGDIEVTMLGYQQPGAEDQSIFLAACSQLGIDGMLIKDPKGEISTRLKADLKIQGDDTYPVASHKTSLRSLLKDAGYKDCEGGANLKRAKDILIRLNNVQIREYNRVTGWDRAAQLLSAYINRKTEEVYIAVNPRLTEALLVGQHVKISLLERNQLTSEVAKILHCWLCSYIRLGKSLGNGEGAFLDTLAPHVWGPKHDGESKQVKSRRRSLLKEGLLEIADATRELHNGYGWAIDITSTGIALVSRPQKLPTPKNSVIYTPGLGVDRA
jgi:hypothetical protein